MNYSQQLLSYFSSLEIKSKLPKGVGVLHPYRDSTAWDLCQQFYTKYYNDQSPRTLIIGINPGRFGGGVTGIPFTDPIRLEQVCGIANTLPKKAELSSGYIYEVIHAFGGPEKFYKQFYFTSVSPLGFVMDGKNLNYYDVKGLPEALLPFILSSMNQQLDMGMNRSKAFCLGEGDNFKFLTKLNNQHHFFEEIVPLPHPRFIMQYRRKRLAEYVDFYVEKLKVSRSTVNQSTDHS